MLCTEVRTEVLCIEVLEGTEVRTEVPQCAGITAAGPPMGEVNTSSLIGRNSEGSKGIGIYCAELAVLARAVVGIYCAELAVLAGAFVGIYCAELVVIARAFALCLPVEPGGY